MPHRCHWYGFAVGILLLVFFFDILDLDNFVIIITLVPEHLIKIRRQSRLPNQNWRSNVDLFIIPLAPNLSGFQIVHELVVPNVEQIFYFSVQVYNESFILESIINRRWWAIFNLNPASC